VVSRATGLLTRRCSGYLEGPEGIQDAAEPREHWFKSTAKPFNIYPWTASPSFTSSQSVCSDRSSRRHVVQYWDFTLRALPVLFRVQSASRFMSRHCRYSRRIQRSNTNKIVPLRRRDSLVLAGGVDSMNPFIFVEATHRYLLLYCTLLPVGRGLVQ
jgi:hypothetical protein